MRILGMMSGTSVDGIDAALCEFSPNPHTPSGADVRLLAFREHPIAPALRARIFQVFQNGPGSLALATSLTMEVGAAYRDAALAFFAEHPELRQGLHAIAMHGQTVWHQPPGENTHAAGYLPSTLQVGEAAVVAQALDTTVISDFRPADMAAGGNGAPLVPYADWHLFSHPTRTRVVLNIGGIANLTLLPAATSADQVIAFDTGPGNMICDALVTALYPGETFDNNGAHARTGSPLQALLEEWMAHPSISAAPPKTTGRELFGTQFAEHALKRHPNVAPSDLLATAVEFTARSIARNIALYANSPTRPLDEIYVGGGGARNTYLLQRLHAALEQELQRPISVDKLDALGWPSQAREAVAFALLGHATLQRQPGNVPSATGAQRPAVLGKITFP